MVGFALDMMHKLTQAEIDFYRAFGRKGGLARAASLTKAQRVRIAKRAARLRWKKSK